MICYAAYWFFPLSLLWQRIQHWPANIWLLPCYIPWFTYDHAQLVAIFLTSDSDCHDHALIPTLCKIWLLGKWFGSGVVCDFLCNFLGSWCLVHPTETPPPFFFFFLYWEWCWDGLIQVLTEACKEQFPPSVSGLYWCCASAERIILYGTEVLYEFLLDYLGYRLGVGCLWMYQLISACG